MSGAVVWNWDGRYAEPGFAYGTEPNAFLKEHAKRVLADPVLSLAEGEGRNAVFLAGLGFKVLGVDASGVGLAKARELASFRGLRIETVVCDLGAYEPAAGSFGGVVSIFAHLPAAMRKVAHARAAAALRPGACVLLEAYTPRQIAFGTGGPKEPELCMSPETLPGEFPGCEVELCQEIEREVIEGKYHTGRAAVVQFIARKR